MALVSPEEIRYQEANVNADASGGLYASSITMMVVTTTAVTLRLLCKRKLSAKVTLDDYCIMVALVLIYGLCIELIICAQFGGGRHAIVVPIPKQIHMMQMIWAFELTYATTTTVIKGSILLLYRRMFPTTATPFVWRAAWYFVMAWVILWWLGCGLATLFQCTPISFFWNQLAGDTSGFCINEYSFLAANAALNITSDIMILMLPMPIVWDLHIKKSQKLAISTIFLLGGFVCVASVIRYTYLKQVIPVDVTYTNQPAGIWSLVEVGIGLVCACLPVMRPLLQHFVPRWASSLADSLDKKTISWSRPYPPQSATVKTGRTSVSYTRPILTPPDSVKLSRMESFPSKPSKPTHAEADYSGETKKTGIVKSISYSSNWSSQDEEK
ncbi:hypothetical protein MMC19_002654, partial [Ptychographa xylographoides]|nr:hypothetical protein [Ptychographa xylographoides]